MQKRKPIENAITLCLTVKQNNISLQKRIGESLCTNTNAPNGKVVVAPGAFEYPIDVGATL